jgi:hypothetical protein
LRYLLESWRNFSAKAGGNLFIYPCAKARGNSKWQFNVAIQTGDSEWQFQKTIPRNILIELSTALAVGI